MNLPYGLHFSAFKNNETQFTNNPETLSFSQKSNLIPANRLHAVGAIK